MLVTKMQSSAFELMSVSDIAVESKMVGNSKVTSNISGLTESSSATWPRSFR